MVMLSVVLSATAFTTPLPAARLAIASTRAAAPSMNAAFLALDAVEPAITSYVNIWVPLYSCADWNCGLFDRSFTSPSLARQV
jgi:hypothetical protein